MSASSWSFTGISNPVELRFRVARAFPSCGKRAARSSGPVQFAAGQLPERLFILAAGSGRHVIRQRRGGRLFVPANGFQIIADVLFIERFLALPRLVLVRRPEAGGIWSQNFIRDDNSKGCI